MAHIEDVADSPPPKRSTKKKGTHAVIRFYLVAYNILSALGWSYVLIGTLVHLFALDSWHETSPPSLLATISQKLSTIPYLSRAAPFFSHSSFTSFEAQLPPVLVPIFRRATTTYARIGYQTAIVQSFAILEVLHALLGWVRSPVATTAIQVASRYYLVWGVTYFFKSTQTNPFYASMVLSWSISEVIRYVYYAISLLGQESPFLLYLRYTTFYLLYPTGASSEAFLIYASLPLTSTFASYTLHDDIRALLFAIWWPGKWDALYPGGVGAWVLLVLSFVVRALCDVYAHGQATSQGSWEGQRKDFGAKTQIPLMTFAMLGALGFMMWMRYL